ncbi:MAG: tRNA uridine-5-carboxymethylaminomethyl(34) synthesis GTPase MnmE [Pyrinomonadaceae bacterium]|nr:tRNA uridine-5-carboxymethylaminomethyl(34) synthesis GTPase MnmE [Pyrinomonadaceae bacterium]
MNVIVALATPLGRSGIGVIRLSGEGALDIVRKLVRNPSFSPEPRFASLQKIYDLETADVLDETLITYFQSPQSFTGEDVIEISGHGSPVILRQIIDSCLALNARMAEAGEFSLRALGNGRMNLSQAEAIRDLIDAQTAAVARQSIRQLSGELSNQIQPLKDDLLNIIVILESSIEFVEDDLPEFQTEKIKAELQEISQNLEAMAATFQAGKLLREGLRVALVGRPNVGKSSLFNTLLGTDRAIVTEIAGTTRDQLHEKFTINNIPISLIDTAGLRETVDVVESIGVERSKRAMIDADLVIVILDGSEELTSEDDEILTLVKDLNHLIAINKTDLSQKRISISNTIGISAKTKNGIGELLNSIIEPFSSQNIENNGFLITDARHYDLLSRAKLEIDSSIISIVEAASEEIILIGLHNAMRFLGEITGETTTEDMLTRIFSTFCIGK